MKTAEFPSVRRIQAITRRLLSYYMRMRGLHEWRYKTPGNRICTVCHRREECGPFEDWIVMHEGDPARHNTQPK